MKNSGKKLPGTGWMILSFIPVLNWISLLYIGIINANTVHIVCAIAYGLVSFALPSAGPLLWVASIFHYSIAYSSVKEQISTIHDSSAVQPRALPKCDSTSGAQDYSEVTIPGEVEHRQAIPMTFSIDTPQNKFFRDMQEFAAKEGTPTAFVPFMAYWPTYDSMDKPQQAWYFYWRSQVRLGNYLDTDLSYIFILIYEFLSGIGWQTPQDGYNLLIQLWSAYQERFPKLDRYMPDWTFDFALMHGLEHNASWEQCSLHLAPSAMTDMLVAQHAEGVPLKLPFTLIDALCDYSLVNSKFYKDGNHGLMQEAIPRVVALADAVLLKKTQKGILATYGPQRPKKQVHYTFSNAVCPQANKKISLVVKAYSTNQRLRGYINELVRYGENTLRKLKGCRGRLRGVTLDDETARLIEAFLKKEYGQSMPKSAEPSKNAEVTLDFGNINMLREQSDAVRSALQVEETVAHAEKMLLTDIQEVTAIYISLSSEARQLLDHLERSEWECEQTPADETLMIEINRLAEHYLGCALLVKEDTTIIVEDDYRDELAHIYENPPKLPEAGSTYGLFNLSVLSPDLKELVEHLVPEQQKVLYTLITCEHPQRELEQIAEEMITMPQILLDGINVAAMQILGDIIVDTMDQKPCILNEYAALLKQSIA